MKEFSCKTKIISGAIHYFRVVPEYWYDRLSKLKACGFNTLETYMSWNLHEESEGVFNFEGMLDIVKYIEIAKELGLIQENDLGALEKIVDAVLAKPETKKAQDDFKAGQEKVLGFLVGQVMKESHGKANPGAVQEILRKKLS